MIVQRLKARNAAQRLAQAPTNPIAHDRVAYFLRHGDADSRSDEGLGLEPAVCLQCKRLELRSPPSRGSLKLGATGQSPPIGAFGRRSPCRLVQGVGPAQ